MADLEQQNMAGDMKLEGVFGSEPPAAPAASAPSAAAPRSRTDTYRVLGGTRSRFSKERTEYFDLAAVTRACNYNGVDKACNDRIRALRDNLLHNRFRKTCVYEGRELVGLVMASKKQEYGRYATHVKGHKGPLIIGWNEDDEPEFDGPGVHASTLASMTRVLRHHVQRGLYHDLDIVNCHPTVALQLFQRHGLPAPLLQRYVSDKDVWQQRLQELTQQPKDDVKKLLLSMLNVGYVETWRDKVFYTGPLPAEIQDLRDEIKRNRDALLELEPYCQVLRWCEASEKRKPRRSAWSILLQDIERRIMECLVQAAEADDWVISAHVYDGFMAQQRGDTPLQPHVMDAWCREAHAKTGFQVQLAIKLPPAEDPLAHLDGKVLLPSAVLYPGEAEPVADAAESESEPFAAESDKDAALYFIDKYGQRLRRCQGKLYMRNGLAEWKEGDKAMDLLQEVILREDVRYMSGKAFTGNLRHAVNVSKAVYKLLPETDLFPDAFRTSTYCKLCFADGVVNMVTHEFLPWEQAQDVHTAIVINRRFPQARDEVLMLEVDERLFKGTFGADQSPCAKNVLASGVAGQVDKKNWGAFIGPRNAGKSMLLEKALPAALGDYVCSVKGENFIMPRDPTGDQARRMHWMHKMQHARICRVSEIFVDEDNKAIKLNGALIKSIVGGDEQGSREIFEKESKYFLQATLIMAANELPPIKPADTAENLVLFACPYRYVTKEEKAQLDPDCVDSSLRIRDPHMQEWVSRQDVADAVLHLLLDAFTVTKQPLCSTVLTNTVGYRAALGDEFLLLRTMLMPGRDPEHFAASGDIRDEVNVLKRKYPGFKPKQGSVKKLLERMGCREGKLRDVRGWFGVRLQRLGGEALEYDPLDDEM